MKKLVLAFGLLCGGALMASGAQAAAVPAPGVAELGDSRTTTVQHHHHHHRRRHHHH